MTHRPAAFAALLLSALLASAAPADASGARNAAHDREMLRLDPTTRIEQRCDARAMGEVSRHHPGMKPDELVTYAYADPEIRDQSISAPGAAVRSKGTWYHLAFRCTTSADGLDVLSFEHRLGTAIPRSDWDGHYLVAP